MKFLTRLFLVCFILCGCSGFAFAQGFEAVEVQAVEIASVDVDSEGGVTLTWDPNDEADLDGYRIHVGLTPGNYDFNNDVEETVNKHKVTGLEIGKTYVFALTAYDKTGNESVFSDEVSAIADDVVGPKKPSGLSKVTVNINININTK